MKEHHDAVMTQIIVDCTGILELLNMGAIDQFDDLARLIHRTNRAKGFWDMAFVSVPLPDDSEAIEFDPSLRNVGEAIALMHSELSEALEAHRKGTMDDKLTHLPGIWVELADTIIRILDLAAAHSVSLQPIILQKMIYNADRPYKHGKAY